MAAPSAHPDDGELVRAALAEDPVAIDALVVRLRCIPRIVNVLNQRVGGGFGAEDLGDLTQETLTTLWSRIGTYSGQASLETWAYGFCFNVFMSALRRRRGRACEAIDEASLPEGREPDGSSLEHEDLHRGLERLDAKDARVIRLKYFDDLTFEEIGARLGLSPNTAKTCYYRGMKRLADLLGSTTAAEEA